MGIQKIGFHAPVSVVGQNTEHRSAQPAMDKKGSLQSCKAGGDSFLSKVWAAITAFFQKIFCCCFRGNETLGEIGGENGHAVGGSQQVVNGDKIELGDFERMLNDTCPAFEGKASVQIKIEVNGSKTHFKVDGNPSIQTVALREAVREKLTQAFPDGEEVREIQLTLTEPRGGDQQLKATSSFDIVSGVKQYGISVLSKSRL